MDKGRVRYVIIEKKHTEMLDRWIYFIIQYHFFYAVRIAGRDFTH